MHWSGLGSGREDAQYPNDSLLPGLSAHKGRSESFNTNTEWSLVCGIRFESSLAKELHPRHPPRAVSAMATNALIPR